MNSDGRTLRRVSSSAPSFMGEAIILPFADLNVGLEVLGAHDVMQCLCIKSLKMRRYISTQVIGGILTKSFGGKVPSASTSK